MANISTSASPLAGYLASMPEPSISTIGVASAAVLFLSFILFPSLFRSKQPADSTKIRELGGFAVLTAWPFFTRRYDFMWHHFKQTGEKMFRFKVLQHSVVALKGEEAREIFFGDKNLDFTEGYRILMGGAPDLKTISVEKEPADRSVSVFNKRLLTLLRRDRLGDMLPILFDDINRRTLDWGKAGKINPFKEVYDLVFQMTVRMASCRELAVDKNTIDKLYNHYWALEKSATPVQLLLPWFPGPAKRAKKEATTQLFTILKHYVDLRRAADVPTTDAIDMLIADNCNDMEIIQFVLSVIFAGVINTGINSCWLLLYLGANPEWRTKVVAEIKELVAKHTNTTSSDPLHKRLASIPIAAWEDEMPVMDLMIRETIRLTVAGTALRRNIVQDIVLPSSGKVVPAGDFVSYPLSDAHLNPEIYADPLRFDPSRYGEGREEDKKGTFSYLGWGAGRHPCTGMKVAKLEIKMIVALFIGAFEFELVDKNDKPPKNLPEPDRNDIQQSRPIGEPCFIKFKRVEE